MRFVLASESPARAALLRQIGLRFDVRPSGIAEELAPDGDPAQSAEELALAKARCVAAVEADAIVIASDTVVALDGVVLGKPVDRDDARAMLGRLSGRWHQVISGLAVVNGEARAETSCHEVTSVLMARLDPQTIEGYVASGEPLGKAGAYAIQGRGALLVDRIVGCYYNVVGLPIARLRDQLRRVGIDVDRLLLPLADDAGDTRGR